MTREPLLFDHVRPEYFIYWEPDLSTVEVHLSRAMYPYDKQVHPFHVRIHNGDDTPVAAATASQEGIEQVTAAFPGDHCVFITPRRWKAQ